MTGWFENLDREVQEHKAEEEKRSVSWYTQDELRNVEVESDELKKARNLFLEHVTMAGVEDIHKSKTQTEKFTFLIAICLALSGLTFTSSRIIGQFVNPKVIYDRYPIAGYQPPFPNVSICGPLSMNRTVFKDFLFVPQRTINLIKRHNISLDDVVEFTLDFWRTDKYPRTITDPVIAQASIQIMDASVTQFSKGYSGLGMSTYPTCQEMFNNCYFTGQPFDCCRAAKFVHTMDSICYHFDINRIPDFRSSPHSTGGYLDDPTDVASAGLLVNVSFDRNLASFFEDVVQEGFRVTVGPMPGGQTMPEVVPAAADALVTIAAKKEEELTNCRPNWNLPKMQFFDYYDPTGQTYYYDTGPLEGMVHEGGCDIPILSHIPENTTLCKPKFFFILKTLNDFEGVDLKRKGTKKIKDWDMHIRLLQSLREALPICNRWSYSIQSASYGFVQEQNRQERNTGNLTWSRIRVFFPESSYILRIQKPVDTPYTAVWRIGGLATVYIGVSMIGTVQLAVFGSNVAYAAALKYITYLRK